MLLMIFYGYYFNINRIGAINMKYIVRRIAVGIAILSFFLPWVEDFFMKLSGFKIMLMSFGLGSDFDVSELVAMGVILLLVLGTAIWVMIHPKRLSTILFLVVSSFVLLMFY